MNEYKILNLKTNQKNLMESEKALNDLSSAGWNLIAVCESESENVKIAFLKKD